MAQEISLDQFNAARQQMLGGQDPAAQPQPQGSGQGDPTPAWLTKDQESEFNAFVRNKAFTPRAGADMLANFAKANGRQWTPQIDAAQVKALEGWGGANGAPFPEGVTYVDNQNGVSLEDFARAQQNANAPAQEKAPGFFDDPLGYLSGSSRTEFPNMQELNFGNIGGLSGAGYQAATSLAFDDQGKQGILAQVLAEQKPTFSTDKFGNAIVTFGEGGNKGKSYYINKPGFSGQDASTLGANIALTAIPGGLAGRSAATAGMGALRVGTASGLAAATGDVARQTAGNFLGDNTRKDNLIPGISIPEATIAGLGEGIPAGYSTRATANIPPVGTTPRLVDNIDNAAAVSDRTGVQFSRGQVANDGASRARTAVLAESPETATAVKEFMANQSEQVRTLANDIATPTTTNPVLLEKRATDAAGQVIADAKGARRAAADPAYSAALDNKPPVDTTNLVSQLETMRGNVAPGTTLSDKLESTIKMLKAEDSWQLTPRQLASVKQELRAAKQSAPPALANEIGAMEKSIETFIENNAAGYKAANDLWRKLSVPVEQLEGSAVGKLAELDSFGLDKFTENLFASSSKLTASRGFVKQNLDKVDPTLYTELAQNEMNRRLGLIKTTEGANGARNVPQQINDALFPNEEALKMWQDALPGMSQQLADLRDALQISTRARALGSNTVPKGAERDALTSGLEDVRIGNTTLWGSVLSMANWMAKNTVGRMGKLGTAQKRLGALDEELNVDYAKLADEYITKIGNPNTPQAKAVVSFLQGVRQFAGSDAMPPEAEKKGVLAE